ncbi:MAG: hypothetical protein WCG87_00010 [Bacteroidota bacterium]
MKIENNGSFTLKALLAVNLFIIQMYILFNGLWIFNKYSNPYALFITSLIIPVYFLWLLIAENYQIENKKVAIGTNILAGILGIITIAICYQALQALFIKWDAPRYSDVIPQLETQYNRFSNGKFPYALVDLPGYQAYPVYMPLHWLPIAIPKYFGLDVRWVGIIFFAMTTFLYAYKIANNKADIIQKIVAIFLPSLVIWAYVLSANIDLPVSLETEIAAYYMVLAIGLATRNLLIITIGIILCLLSRYTMIFWLPLFLILLFLNTPLKKNIWVWGSIFFSTLFIYIIPFYLKDPSILSQGISYHNAAAIYEWNGCGHPPVSETFESGINFAHHMKDLFQSGDMTHRVFMARVVQGSLILCLMLAGLLIHRRWRSKLNFYDLSLAMLYMVLLCFFMFGPLTYRYYYMPLFAVSAIICSKIILLSKPDSTDK